MISFDDFIKQDDGEKYMQRDIFQIQALEDELENRDMYITKLEVAFSKEIERLNKELQLHKEMEKIAIDCQNELTEKIEKATEYIKKLDKDYDINVYQEDKHWAYVLYLLGADKE